MDKRLNKYVIGAAAAAGLVGGSVAVAAVSPLGSALARPTTVQVGQAGSDPSTPGTSVPGAKGKSDRGAHIDEALQGLVDKGTITIDQRDAVRQALLDHMGSNGPNGKGRHGGGPGMMGGIFRDGLDTVAKRLNMSPEDLMTQLRSGSSIADVARSKGIDPAAVVNDLVAEATTKIDEAVAAGKLKADKADKIKARLPQMIQEIVDHKGRGGFRGDWKANKPGVPDAQQGAGQDQQSPPPTTTASAPATAAPTTAAPPTTEPTTSGTAGAADGPTTTTTTTG